MDHCANQRESDNDDGESAYRRVDPVTHLTGQYSRQRTLGNNREYGRVVVFKRGQKCQNGGRGNSRLQERQQNLSEDLGMRGPQVQCRLFKAGIKTLQPGEEDQHGVRRDKGRLADDGHEVAIIEKAVLRAEHHTVDPFPENQRRDTQHHTGHQDGRNGDRIHHRTCASLELRQQKRCREANRHSEQHHSDTHKQTAAQAAHEMLILDQNIEPLACDAVPGRNRRKLGTVKRRKRHHDQGTEKIGEKQQNVEPDCDPHDACGGHRPISPILTLKIFITANTRSTQVSISTMA